MKSPDIPGRFNPVQWLVQLSGHSVVWVQSGWWLPRVVQPLVQGWGMGAPGAGSSGECAV
ncbi:hypothetical protein [Luteipulveratus halotolerans]|uniref:hypothetical protein n=1 Tax=Luteipulveratus halotolerans TaxID=1631356 RepID=UPI0012F93C06|nr:hypothetical protein [Luteipulveratus halotolerans]